MQLRGMVEGFPPNEAMHVGHGGNNSPLQARFLITGEENCEPRPACSPPVPLLRGTGNCCMSAMVEELPPLAVPPAYRGRISPRIRPCSPRWWKNFPCRGGRKRRMVEGFPPGVPCQAWCGRGLPDKDTVQAMVEGFPLAVPTRVVDGGRISPVRTLPPVAYGGRISPAWHEWQRIGGRISPRHGRYRLWLSPRTGGHVLNGTDARGPVAWQLRFKRAWRPSGQRGGQNW